MQLKRETDRLEVQPLCMWGAQPPPVDLSVQGLSQMPGTEESARTRALPPSPSEGQRAGSFFQTPMNAVKKSPALARGRRHGRGRALFMLGHTSWGGRSWAEGGQGGNAGHEKA